MRYLIKNAVIVDGSGKAGYKSDLLIQDGKIEKIEPSIKADNAEIIDAKGKTLTPGFIDIHRHSDVAPLRDENYGDIELRQGITTTIVGNCGLSPVPLSSGIRNQMYDYLEPVIGKVPEGIAFSSYKEYVDTLKRANHPLNMGFLAASDTIKVEVKGFSNKSYTESELKKARDLVEDAMENGAFGASLGIMYLPECYSTAKEMAYVVSPLKEYDGLLSTHIRGEGDSLVESVEEVIDIARMSLSRLNISHFKATGIKNWNSLIYKAIEKIEKARAEGLSVTCDFYPYDGGSTTLQSLIPPSVMREDPEKTLEYLRTDEGKRDFRNTVNGETPLWDNMAKSIGWDRILICSVEKEENKWMQGRDIKSLAKETGYSDPADFASTLYTEEDGKVGIIVLSMANEDIEKIARLEYSALISDSLYGGGKAHPRLYGSFPRFLRVFVKERNILSFEEAVKKMTALPAERIRLNNRGLIKEGYVADINIFDRDQFIDNADYSGKSDLASGMDYLFISGREVIKEGKIINRSEGSFLLKR